MKLTKKAQRDHPQPCQICQGPIRKGESFWTFLREATLADEAAGVYKFFNQHGRRHVQAKAHADCWQMRKDFQQWKRGMLRIWWGSTRGRSRWPRQAPLQN